MISEAERTRLQALHAGLVRENAQLRAQLEQSRSVNRALVDAHIELQHAIHEIASTAPRLTTH